MSDQPRILYCHCAYAQVVPKEVKDEVLRQLSTSGVAFDAVPDLCEMSAKGDATLARLVGDGNVKIAACYPRAVKWLFKAAGIELPGTTEVANMRTEPAERVVAAVLGQGFGAMATVAETQEVP
jgi:hypothetical protein